MVEIKNMFLIGLIKIPQEKAEVVKKNLRKSKIIIIIITVINNKIPIFPLAKIRDIWKHTTY